MPLSRSSSSIRRSADAARAEPSVFGTPFNRPARMAPYSSNVGRPM